MEYLWLLLQWRRNRLKLIPAWGKMISNDDRRASARAVRDVWLISTTDSRTERLYIRSTDSVQQSSLYRSYITYPAVVDVWEFPKRCPRIVFALKYYPHRKGLAKKKILKNRCGVWSKRYGVSYITSFIYHFYFLESFSNSRQGHIHWRVELDG